MIVKEQINNSYVRYTAEAIKLKASVRYTIQKQHSMADAMIP